MQCAGPDHQSCSAEAGEELLCIQVYFGLMRMMAITAPALTLEMASSNCDPSDCTQPSLVL